MDLVQETGRPKKSECEDNKEFFALMVDYHLGMARKFRHRIDTYDAREADRKEKAKDKLQKAIQAAKDAGIDLSTLLG
jgi:hypothetical protein